MNNFIYKEDFDTFLRKIVSQKGSRKKLHPFSDSSYIKLYYPECFRDDFSFFSYYTLSFLNPEAAHWRQVNFNKIQ